MELLSLSVQAINYKYKYWFNNIEWGPTNGFMFVFDFGQNNHGFVQKFGI